MEHADDDPGAHVEQFSEQSRAALAAATQELVAGLQRYAEAVLPLRGGARDVPAVFAAGEEVEALVDAWTERAFDHTGTFPLALVERGADLDDDEHDDDVEELSVVVPVSVVSRFDLVVTDAPALLDSGRSAYLRTWPDEDAEDAAEAVNDLGSALYAVAHERGEPWYGIDGVEVVRGVRQYVRTEEVAEPLTEDDEADERVVEPPGDRLLGESWA